MPSKRDVLNTLTTNELRGLVDAYGLDAPDRRRKDALVDAVAEGVDLAAELSAWPRDDLKALCRQLGLDDGGRAKAVIVDRLLAPDGRDEPRPAPRKKGVTGKTEPPGTKPVPTEPTGNATARLEMSALEDLLWKAACVIRGPVDAPKFKDYILPLIFLKRLSDVYDDEIDHLAEEYGDRALADRLARDDHRSGGTLVRFYIPDEARWNHVAALSTRVGQSLTDAVRAVARENPRLKGVIDVTDFNVTAAGQRVVDDDRLKRLVQQLSDPKYRLGLDDVEPDILGRAYEYLLRKFSEGQGSSGGERFTPPEVARTMARILDPQPGETGYDPCLGSAGLLIKCHLRLLETHGEMKNGRRVLPAVHAPLKLHGQEIEAASYAIARMNAVLHDLDVDVRLGDTMRRPAFTRADGSLERFDLVTANPMWNQKFTTVSREEDGKTVEMSVYENDPYDRFERGVPPSASADWGWLQHMLAHLADDGRMAVVLDTGAVSRGSGNQGSNKERDIRKRFVEDDLVEAVVLFADNLFYNTSAPAVVLVVNRAKQHADEILLINASKLCAKGRPKNYLTDEHIATVAELYHEWRAEEGLSVVIGKDEAVKADYNLSPSRFVSTGDEAEVLPLDEAVVLLAEAEEERVEADRRLDEVLAQLGFEGWRHG